MGFGNIIKSKKIELIYVNEKSTYKIETNIDIRKQIQNSEYIINIDDKLPANMKEGKTLNLTLKILNI